nr:DNA-binding response regulator [Streptococcus thermophilus]
MTTSVRVVLVDDQQLMRQGLSMLLGTVDEIEVVGEAADGAEALSIIERTDPDAVLADARMPGMDGLELTAQCALRHPGVPVIILTTFDDTPVVEGALAAGAAGFLLKDSSTDDLVAAVRAAISGGLVIDPRVARTIMTKKSPASAPAKLTEDSSGFGISVEALLEQLTPTERRVATFISRGLNNREIAGDLVLAEGTVKNHVSAVMRKLLVHDRTRLALLLRDHEDKL